MELVNTHCHSKYCGHGAGEVEDYAAAAEAAGLTTLAFTEHFPLPASLDPDEYLSVTERDMPLYCEAVEQARRDHPNLEIVLGTELDYLGALEERDLANGALAPFAYVLGSVHFIDGWAFDDPAQRARWDEPGAPDAIWRRYVELWCQAAADPSLPYDAMSHPDLAKKFGYYPSYGLAPLYARMAEAAAAGGRMVEVNTSGAHYACAEMFPAPELLAAFRRAGVPCTVGTDAHDPANIARGFEQACRLMHEAGYRHLTVPTASGDRRRIALE